MNWIQVIAALGLVFGLLALLYWLANRAGVPGLRRGNKLIRVVERHPLGDKRMLMLVEVGGETFLLGSTSQNISLVSVVRASESGQSAEDSEFEDQSTGPGFRQILGMLR